MKLSEKRKSRQEYFISGFFVSDVPKGTRRAGNRRSRRKMMSGLSQLIGNRIRGFRKMQHLSQGELAERCGLHPAYIGQLERGEKNATLESVQSICRGLQITMDQLFYGIVPDDSAAGDFNVTEQIGLLLDGLDTPEQMAVYHMILEALKLKS